MSSPTDTAARRPVCPRRDREGVGGADLDDLALDDPHFTVTFEVTVVTPGTCGLSIRVTTVPSPAVAPRTVTE